MSRPSRNAHHAVASTQQPLDEFTPFKDRRVNVRSVVCPVCKAPVGAFCVNLLGTTGTSVKHDPRRRLAIRLEREQEAS